MLRQEELRETEREITTNHPRGSFQLNRLTPVAPKADSKIQLNSPAP